MRETERLICLYNNIERKHTKESECFFDWMKCINHGFLMGELYP